MANAAEFLIKINEQVSGPAAAASGALQRLESQIRRETSALGEAEAAMAKFEASGAGSIAQHDALAAKIGKASDALGALKGALPSAEASAAAGPMRDFGNALGDSALHAADLPGPIGAIQNALSKLGPEGEAAAMAIGLATIAITAFVAVTAGGMALAIHMTETLGRMRVAFDSLAGGAAAGGKVSAMVERLGQSLPYATSEIAKWSASLLQAGVPAAQLESRLKAIAAATALTALTGGGGGAAAEAMFRRLSAGGAEADAFLKKIAKGGKAADHDLKEMGISLAELGGKAKVAKMKAGELGDAIAKALAAKGGKALAAEMNTLPVIFMKAKEGAMSLFSGMGPQVEKFMASVAKLFSAFNKGGVAIQILKPIVTSVFGTLFSWATKALDAAYAGFLRVAIWGVKAYIMAHPLVGAFGQLWAAVVKLGVALGIVGGKSSSFGILALVGKIVSNTFQAVIAVIGGVIGAVTAVVGVVTRVVAAIRGALAGIGGSGKGAGGSLVSGLIAGIMGGAGAVIAAVKGLAAGALSAFTGAFGIKSPSRVMLKHGDENIAGALAGGVDKGAPKVERSMGKLGGKPGGVSGGKGNGGGGDINIDLRGAHFGGDLTEEKLEGWLLRILERARRGASEMETT